MNIAIDFSELPTFNQYLCGAEIEANREFLSDIIMSDDKSSISFQNTMDNSNMLVDKRMLFGLIKLVVISNQPDSR